ncbi:MAG: hypothetical protein Q4G33_03415 [bacterium]|nr:hypothetical protein [bacterium]
MKKSVIAAVAAASGAVIFASAAIANYTTANGYEVVKDSLFGLFGTENYTYDFEMSMDEGEDYVLSFGTHTEMDEPNKRCYMNDTNSTKLPGEDHSYQFKRWYNDNMTIYQHDDGQPEGYTTEARDSSMTNYTNMFSDELFGDADTTAKVLHFMEVALDTAVGDLKNNFIYTGTEDGVKTYNLSLDAIQIPELLNAGLSAFASVTADNNEGFENVSEEEQWVADIVTMDNVYTDSISGVFAVNEDNSFNSGEVSAVITGKDRNGETHNLTFRVKMGMSDAGSTVPQPAPENVNIRSIQY